MGDLTSPNTLLSPFLEWSGSPSNTMCYWIPQMYLQNSMQIHQTV